MADSDDETPTDHQLKFVVLGDGASGKVSLLDKLLKPLRLMESYSWWRKKRPSINIVWPNRGAYSFFRHRSV